MQFLARRYDTLEPVRVSLRDGRVDRVVPATPSEKRTVLPWVSPGFVDIQVNGYRGQEFNSLDLTPEKVTSIVRDHYAFGVTGICPTQTTQSFESLAHGMKAIAASCEQDADTGRAILGIHLEGPYFSIEDGPRGAHPKEHCRQPDWNEFQKLQEAAGGRLRILTMSPEFENAADFIAQVVSSGVTVAIGHTGATGDQIRAAVDAGATLSTHLGNGAHRMLRRHPNYIWDQLAEDRLWASLIVDGHHLPAEVVKTMVRAKTPQRCILVSDVSGLAGLKVGRHSSSGGDLEILPDGRLVIAGQDQLLAGASLPIGVGVVNMTRFAGVDLADAIHMATLHPCQLLNASGGGLRPGDPANLILFDLVEDSQGIGMIRELNVRGTILNGKLVYGSVTEEK